MTEIVRIKKATLKNIKVAFFYHYKFLSYKSLIKTSFSSKLSTKPL